MEWQLLKQVLLRLCKIIHKELIMRSILYKDFLEQRMYFLIILAVAIVSLLLASWFKQLDAGIAMFLLFVLQGPLFIYLAANHQISSEVNNRTFPFLLSLPVSRGRLWLAKLLFAVTYAILLYVFYFILALLCGVSPGDFLNFFRSSPALAVGLPLVIVSYGYFTSMLPRGFATIATLIVGSFSVAVASSPFTVTTINLGLLTTFLVIIFLSLSLIVFKSDRTMTSQLRGLKGILFLLAAALTLSLCWSLLGAFAERSWQLDEISNPTWVPLNGGRQILWRVSEIPRWWDVVDTERYHSRRLLIQNLETGEIRKLGNRMSSFTSYEKIANAGFVNIKSAGFFSGLLREMDETVYDHDGNPLVRLPLPARHKLAYCKLIDERRFIYVEAIMNGPSVINEFNLYEKEHGNKVVFSAQKGFKFKEFIVMPAKEAGKPADVYICGKSDDAKDQLTLVSVKDGKRTLLPVNPDVEVVAVCSDYIVFDDYRWDRESKVGSHVLVIAWLDGRTRHLDHLTERVEVAGINASGKIVATLYLPGDSAYFNSTMQSLIEIDPDGNTKELFRPEQPGRIDAMLTENRDKAFVFYSSHDTKPLICKHLALDFTTGQISEFASFNSPKNDSSSRIGLPMNRAFHLAGNRFMIETAYEINEVDVASMQIIRRTSFEALYKRMTKGGGQS